MIPGSDILSLIIFLIGYINSYLASRFYIIIIVVFEYVLLTIIVGVVFVLVVVIIFYVLLIIVISTMLFVLLVYFKGNYGRLSDLLFTTICVTNASYWCNCSLFRLILTLLLLCLLIFLLLLGFFLSVFFIVVVVLDVATIVNLYWLRVYY